MATWKLGDATVTSGGAVSGPEDSDAMFELDRLRRGTAAIDVEPSPAVFAVDPRNDWALDRFVREVADTCGVEVETDYEPKDADMPEDIRRYQAACRARAKSSGGKRPVY